MNVQVVLCTHAGRPKGEVVESMRIGNIGGCLGELLDEAVACPTDCIGDKVEEQVGRESNLGQDDGVGVWNQRVTTHQQTLVCSRSPKPTGPTYFFSTRGACQLLSKTWGTGV